jgi:hypothetical protein
MTDTQKKEVCFDWDHKDNRGLLRKFVNNNWQITNHPVSGNFYTKQQQQIIHDVFKGLIHPDWYAKFLKQARDDNRGLPWGAVQSLAIFGTPGTERFECVITGRHMTLRADGNTDQSVAFGGPIFYGHTGGNEPADHKGNLFWYQGVAANKVYKMLDDKQQTRALVARRPAESANEFRPKGGFPGLPVAEMSDDQKKEMQKVLQAMIDPFRAEDQEEVLACLKKQGGLDKCSLAFYKDGDIGDDGEWDNWRLEGPSFVWYFRGQPHVHIWINVADDPSVPLNARG